MYNLKLDGIMRKLYSNLKVGKVDVYTFVSRNVMYIINVLYVCLWNANDTIWTGW